MGTMDRDALETMTVNRQSLDQIAAMHGGEVTIALMDDGLHADYSVIKFPNIRTASVFVYGVREFGNVNHVALDGHVYGFDHPVEVRVHVLNG